MPKQVDHETRRGDVAAAVWRVVSGEGLERATVRRVAAEAGWSTGVLAHYFRDKEELLRFAFSVLVDRIAARATAATTSASSGRDAARRMLMLGLPLDAERVSETRTWFAFLGLALTRPDLARDQADAYEGWRAAIAGALAYDGVRDAEAEAAALVALVDGLAIQATLDPRGMSRKRMLALLDERLARVG